MKSRFPTKMFRYVWLGGEGITLSKMFAFGALVWGLYGVAYLLLKGIVLDEVIQPAQIIAGTVPYPPGHPHQVYYLQAYSLFNYLAGGLWVVIPNPTLMSALRNFLFLSLSTFTPFALTVLLTRRPYWGHVATTLTVSEAMIGFQGVYPLFVFPFFYSHGHVAALSAILVVVLLSAGSRRVGGFLLGLLPSIHPAMAVAVFPWAAAYLLWGGKWRTVKRKIEPVAAFALGIGICAFLAFIVIYQGSQLHLEPPYNVQGNGDGIYQQFVETTNVHTQPFPILSLAYLVSPVALFVIGILLFLDLRQKARSESGTGFNACLGVLSFGLVIWLFIYGAYLYQRIAGPLPFYVSLAKPYRSSNLSAELLIPVTVAAIALALSTMDQKARQLPMTLIVILILGEAIFVRINRVQVVDYLIFVVWGLFFAIDIYAHWQDRNRAIASLIGFGVLTATLILLFVLRGRPLANYFLASFVMGIATLIIGTRIFEGVHLDLRRSDPYLHVGLVLACLAASFIALRQPKVIDSWNMLYDVKGNALGTWYDVTQYDHDLNQWLLMNSEPNALILAPAFPRAELQIKTGHPVLYELETLYLLDYIPRLAPSIGMMTRDLYGIDYGNADQIRSISKNGLVPLTLSIWLDAWKNRRLADWQTLKKKYGFHLILAPSTTPLDLPLALPGPFWTLYTIP